VPVPWWLIDSEREIAGMLADLKLALPSVQATADLNGSNFQGIRTQFGSDRVDIQFDARVPVGAGVPLYFCLLTERLDCRRAEGVHERIWWSA